MATARETWRFTVASIEPFSFMLWRSGFSAGLAAGNDIASRVANGDDVDSLPSGMILQNVKLAFKRSPAESTNLEHDTGSCRQCNRPCLHNRERCQHVSSYRAIHARASTALAQIWQADSRLYFIASKHSVCAVEPRAPLRPAKFEILSYEQSDILRLTYDRTECRSPTLKQATFSNLPKVFALLAGFVIVVVIGFRTTLRRARVAIENPDIVEIASVPIDSSGVVIVPKRFAYRVEQAISRNRDVLLFLRKNESTSTILLKSGQFTGGFITRP